eukprot:286149_1
MSNDILNDVELHTDDENKSPNLVPNEKQCNICHSTEAKDEEERNATAWRNKAYKIGENMLHVADFLGEVFAEFFGMTQSRYQWAIDAYERQQRWERNEKKQEELHKKRVMEQYTKNKQNRKNDKTNQTRLGVAR